MNILIGGCFSRECFAESVDSACPDFCCCCGCCSAFRPRYKTLVDNIYPPNPEDGLIKLNVEKLIYYSMSTPDKLDRIGDYLAHRLNRDINRRKTGYIILTMEVLDQLLVSCHANNLNLFVESFLQMVQKLLESPDPELQLRATQSFEKFANIGEDTPSYHRPYDFLVGKFSSMCFYTGDDPTIQKQLRIAGIKGLQGVVRKTDCESLGENIWLPIHMDKIVPSLLYNLQERKRGIQVESTDTPDNQSEGDREPHELAKMCLRELGSRATYGKISTIIKPLLLHLDNHQMWHHKEFAVQTFEILMYSIQVQYNIKVIEMLMAHLNERSSSDPIYRAGIAYALAKVIPIAAGECIGPSAMDIINSLVEHIRSSVVGEVNSSEVEAEEVYQDTLIHALGEYAKHLPDYQKIDSIIFILNKVPGSEKVDEDGTERLPSEVKLQHLLLKSLLEVGTKYTTVNYQKTFSQSFLVRLMRVSISADPHVRLTVQHILHTLIDRHDNSNKLSRPILDIGRADLSTSKPMRQDINFWKKSGNEILLSLQENCDYTNNSIGNIHAIYTTIMLILTEIRCDDVIVDVLRVLFVIQQSAQRPAFLSVQIQIALHVIVAAVMANVASIVPALKDHIASVIKTRSEKAPYLLPEYNSHCPSLNVTDDCLFDNSQVLSILKDSKLDERRMDPSLSKIPRRPSTIHHHTTSATDITIDVDSAASSPGLPRRPFGEEVTFESLKKVLNDSPEQERKLKEEKRREMTEAFMAESFEALVAKVQQPDALQTKLSEIFSRLPPTCPPASSSSTASSTNVHTTTVSSPPSMTSGCDPMFGVTSDAPYQLPYPDIFIY